MDKKEDNSEPRQIPKAWICLIVIVMLIVCGFLIGLLWKSLPKGSAGGAKRARWGSKGGNCGCSMPPS